MKQRRNKMRNRLRIGFCIFVALFLLVGTGSADDFSQMTDKQKKILPEGDELNSIIENIAPINSKTLETTKANKNVLRVCGKIPNLETGPEVYKWLNELDQIRINLNINRELSPYLHPNGPLMAYGTHKDGHFVVMLSNEYPDVKEDNLIAITEIINKHAIQLNITDVPIVFTSEAPITPVFADWWPALPSYSLKYRPIIGGIAHTVVNGSTGQVGTIGFAAERNSDGQKGYVTAGHVTWFQTGLPVSQPINSENGTGTASKVGINTDAAFVPYNNVLAKIHIGGGNIIDVDGYYSGGISSMVLKKSGCVSGHTTGDYLMVLTGATVNGTFMDKIEVMSTGCSEGDSGGPVYATYYNRNKLVGIICANTTYLNNPATIYIPCGEIVSKLDITPLDA